MESIKNNIFGFDNYHATMCGKVFSTKQKNTIQLKEEENKGGYKKVVLQCKPKSKTALVHRIIATAYKENPNNYPQVNHIDGNKSNNRINNLEWATASMNMRHALKNKLLVPKSLGNHYWSKIVLDLETGIFYTSQKEYALAKGIPEFRVKNENKRKHIKRNYIIL